LEESIVEIFGILFVNRTNYSRRRGAGASEAAILVTGQVEFPVPKISDLR